MSKDRIKKKKDSPDRRESADIKEEKRQKPQKPQKTARPPKSLKAAHKEREPLSDEQRAKKEKRRKARRIILNVLCVLSGSFFVGVYIPYFCWHASKGHTMDIVASLLVFAGVLLPFALHVPLRKLLKKAYLPLKIVWCCVMCFYMVSFSVFFIAVHAHGDVPHVETQRQKVVVVFGCQVHESGALSAELRSRLEKATEILDAYPDALCVVSGGQGQDEPTSEAYAMKKYLVEKRGEKEERILTEERSTSTVENVRYTIETLKEAGYDVEDCSFICVSSTFHTPRTYYLCRRMGVPECATVSAPTPYKFLDYIYTVREYMSYVHLLIFGT